MKPEEAKKLKKALEKAQFSAEKYMGYGFFDAVSIYHCNQIIDQFTEAEPSQDSEGEALKALNELRETIHKNYGGETFQGSEEQAEEIAWVLSEIGKLEKKYSQKEDQEILVLKVLIDRDGFPEVDEWSKSEPWHEAIFAIAASLPECEWVTVDEELVNNEVYYWISRPEMEDGCWCGERGNKDHIFSHGLPKKLIPPDCSKAIVKIEHC